MSANRFVAVAVFVIVFVFRQPVRRLRTKIRWYCAVNLTLAVFSPWWHDCACDCFLTYHIGT